jgi:hypothetical protein
VATKQFLISTNCLKVSPAQALKFTEALQKLWIDLF